MGMSKHVKVQLTPEQRAQLEQLVRSGSSLARTQTKARILLLTDRNQAHPRSDAEIADTLQVSPPTIVRTRRRFVLEGLEVALYDKPRPGAKPKITGDVEAHLTLLACSTPPEGKARWTLQMLADKLVELQLVESISDVAVMHRLKKTNCNPGASSGTVSASQAPSLWRRWKTCWRCITALTIRNDRWSASMNRVRNCTRPHVEYGRQHQGRSRAKIMSTNGMAPATCL